jgi:hypothetical protein
VRHFTRQGHQLSRPPSDRVSTAAFVNALGTVADLARVAGPAAEHLPGWSGITALSQTADWELCQRLGGAVQQVAVSQNSPAWKAGLRPLDFVKKITLAGGVMTLEVFIRTELPVGAVLQIDAIRLNKDRSAFEARTFAFVLCAKPKPKPLPWWKREPAAQTGERVEKKDRPRFLQSFIAKHPKLKHIDTRLMAVLLEYDGRAGIIPSHQTLAKNLHCSVTAIKESLARLNRIGVLEIIRRKQPGRQNAWQSNCYVVCWPYRDCWPGEGTVVPLHRR